MIPPLVIASMTGGFVPFDPAAEAQVSGAQLMIAAYAVIFAFLVVYAVSLFLRSRSVARRAARIAGYPSRRGPGATPSE